MEKPDIRFDPDCTRCPRLAHYLGEVRDVYPQYHARPVPPFGDPQARLLIVGLAPGLHGANASGRPFTGDHAGILLYRTLFDKGLANQRQAIAIDDGLQLRDCRITNAVKCLPPANKPTPEEITTCNGYLASELATSSAVRVILALGRIAHDAVLKALALKGRDFQFAHGAQHDLMTGRWLVDSYHCSRYNTQTRRLTDEMFTAVFDTALALLPGT